MTDEPLSPACAPCREPKGTCFPGLCKLYWRWVHKDGHIRARIVGETADAVDIEYRHVTDKEWAGAARLSKDEFCSTYGMPALPSRRLPA